MSMIRNLWKRIKAMEWINEEARVPWSNVERTHEALTVMQYMRACRDVCNHAIGHSPLSDLVKDEKEKDKYKGISYAYCEERVYLFKIPSGAIVLCKGPNPLDAWKNFIKCEWENPMPWRWEYVK